MGKFGLHILLNPAGTYSYVGNVPIELCEGRIPTRSDILGQNVHTDGKSYHSKRFSTYAEAKKFANDSGFEVIEGKSAKA